MFNALAVALSGFFIFTEPSNGSLWLGGHMLLSTYFLIDAALYSGPRRNMLSVMFVLQAFLQVYSVVAVWQGLFACEMSS